MIKLGPKDYDRMAQEARCIQPGSAAHTGVEIFQFFRPSGLVLDLGCGFGRHTAEPNKRYNKRYIVRSLLSCLR